VVLACRSRERSEAALQEVEGSGGADPALLNVDFEDPEFQRRKFSVQKSYYQSRLAQVLCTYWLAEQLAGISGRCFDENRKFVNTAQFSRDRQAIEKLMSLTERYLGPLAASRSRL
jgi:hypothetical protein